MVAVTAVIVMGLSNMRWVPGTGAAVQSHCLAVPGTEVTGYHELIVPASTCPRLSILYLDPVPLPLTHRASRSYAQGNKIQWKTGSLDTDVSVGLVSTAGTASAGNASVATNVSSTASLCTAVLSGACTAQYSQKYGESLTLTFGALLTWGNATESLIFLRPAVRALQQGIYMPHAC